MLCQIHKSEGVKATAKYVLAHESDACREPNIRLAGNVIPTTKPV
jgi:hypothetical protein